ncbi:MBL fold metallo-hydrolase [Bradyrhizobium cenepequi]|uniref:MBL fold metallo-hydrolase n=1 Tax=Bradyrhizobium cenepequi TaxID=2821403 RepID=UPI001CE2ECEE|nr:MBL fold metallo-hydrolase [Bradyrhizobium cenepequi]
MTKVEEQLLRTVPPSFLYPGLTSEEFAIAQATLAASDVEPPRDALILSVHTWVVKTPRHLILIDTASGNDKERPTNPLFHRQNLPYLEQLRQAGVSPEAVDFVFNTHLHVDHSGWNTRLSNGKWVPTFPNARYVFPMAERDYYSSPASHNEANLPSLGVYEDSVLPVVEAGLADFIGPEGGKYLDVFEFIPTPGHSIGHMSIALDSGGASAIFAGDVMHTVLQVARPEQNTVYCEFADEARKSRQKILSRAAATRALYLSTHFPGSSAGFVTSDAGGFTWRYA